MVDTEGGEHYDMVDTKVWGCRDMVDTEVCRSLRYGTH